MNENTKFFIGMAFSMLVPVIVFSYGQGQVNQSIEQLSKQTLTLNGKVDSMAADIGVATNQLAVNTSDTSRIDREVITLRNDLVETKTRVSVLEYSRGVNSNGSN